MISAGADRHRHELTWRRIGRALLVIASIAVALALCAYAGFGLWQRFANVPADAETDAAGLAGALLLLVCALAGQAVLGALLFRAAAPRPGASPGGIAPGPAVAHDINHILGLVVGNLDLLKDALPKDHPGHPLLDAALRAGERGAALARLMLASSRPGRPAPANANAVASDIRLMIANLLPGTALELRLAADLWPCAAGAGDLHSALLNLVLNARDAMPSGGRLAIETANLGIAQAAAAGLAPAEHVAIAVSDTGAGMSEAARERALAPFYTTKAPAKGAGLGLAIVDEFARRLGGALCIDSAPGQGTRVLLALPRARADA